MRRLRLLVLRLRAIFRSGAVDADLDRELSLHMDQLVREHVAAGLDEAAARRAARRAFGSVDATREQCRDTRRVGVLDDLIKDTRYAWRAMAHSPGFACAAVLSLALGIGANTAIFSIVDAVLLRQLAVDRPGELVFLDAAGSEGRNRAFPYPCIERIRDQVPLAGVAAFASDELRVEVDGQVEQVFGQVVSGTYFDLLGVRPALGRLLTPADERLDPPVAVISHRYWQRRFGGDPSAVGRTMAFKDRVFVIVGVTQDGFTGLQPGRHIDVTFPLTLESNAMANAGLWWLDAVARLPSDATPTQVRSQADAVFQAFQREHSQVGQVRRRQFDRLEFVSASRGLDNLRARFATPLRVMSAIGLAVLLIACANLCSLLLARGESRSRELAIRVATGAGTGRLVRQLLTETLLLFALGLIAGLGLAHVVVSGLTRFFAVGRNPIVLDVHYDWRLSVFAAGVTLIAGLLTGLWPALRAMRVDPQSAMRDGEHRVAGSSRVGIASRLLIGGQVGLSLVLLVVALLFVQTMRNLRSLDLGFRSSHVLTMSLDPTVGSATVETAAAMRETFWRQALDRVRALPGVTAASLSVLTPMSGRDSPHEIAVAGFEPRDDADRLVRLNQVSEDYFQTFGVRVLAGRAFTARDGHQARRVAIVNQAAARAYFGGRNPIGETITLGADAIYTVIGVVADHKHRSLRELTPRFVFVPLWQRLGPIVRTTIAVRSDRPVAELTRAVTSEIYAVHSRTLVSDVIGVEQQIDAHLLSERLLARLASGFAALALVLAAVGLYGTLSYSVTRRRPELGVRLALGASPGSVAAGVVRDVLVPVLAGICLGLPLAYGASRLAEQLLFGVPAAAPATYVTSVAVLSAVAMAAAWLPARRASRIDPAETLRRE